METSQPTDPIQKSDHWYKATRGEEALIFNIERGAYFSGDQDKPDYYLNIFRESGTKRDFRTDTFDKALQSEGHYKTILIEQGFKLERIEKSRAVTVTPSSADQRVKNSTPDQVTPEKKKITENSPQALEKTPSSRIKTEGERPENVSNGRSAMNKPETEQAGGSVLDEVEAWIPTLTEDAHKGVGTLKKQLEENVDEGGNWFVASMLATGLDVADAAMTFTEGIPAGILDMRHFGEGIAEGTFGGLKRDFSRLSNVLPQGKVVRAVERVMLISDVVEGLEQENFGAAGAPGAGSLPGIGKVKKSRLRKLEHKLGIKADELIYNDGEFFIASDKFLKNVKRNKGTKMDSNHLLLAEWFRKGPEYIKGLQHFVPSFLLRNGMEHQGTFHGAFNEFMKKHGLFQKKKYSITEIETAILKAENYFLKNPGGDLGKAWSDACKKFRSDLFDKAKK